MSDRLISEAIRTLAGTTRAGGVFAFDAVVKSVDKAARTCVVYAITGKTQSEIPDVRLMAAVDDGVLIIPAVDSNVTIIVTAQADAYVTQYSEVEEIIFRGGDLGGLVKLLDAVDRFNKIEDDLNSIKQAFTTWTPTPNDGGAALKAAAATWSAQQLIKTVRSDIENEKIKQG
jgi:hypothetical protein